MSQVKLDIIYEGKHTKDVLEIRLEDLPGQRVMMMAFPVSILEALYKDQEKIEQMTREDESIHVLGLRFWKHKGRVHLKTPAETRLKDLAEIVMMPADMFRSFKFRPATPEEAELFKERYYTIWPEGLPVEFN